MTEQHNTGPGAAPGAGARPGAPGDTRAAAGTSMGTSTVPAPRAGAAASSHPWARPAGGSPPSGRAPGPGMGAGMGLAPSVRDAARRWEPSRSWVHPVAAGLWVYVAGWLPSFGGFSPLVMLAVAAAAAVIGVGFTRRIYPEHRYGREHRAQMLALCVVGGLMAAGWWCWAGSMGPAGPTAPSSVAGLVLLVALFTGGFATVYRRAPIAAAVMVERVAEETRQEFAVLWNRLLAAAGLPGARVAARVEHQVEDGPASGYTLRIDGSRGHDGVITAHRAREKLGKLTGLASVELAKPPHRAKIRDGALRIEASDVSHVWFLHVTTSEPLARTVPYVPVTAPGQPLSDAAPQRSIGWTKLGVRWLLKLLRVHVKIVGATQSGKTTLIRRVILSLLETGNVEVVVMATDKLNPLVLPFLEPWLTGRTDRPALAGVFGPEHADFLAGLAELYRLVRLRNGDLGKAGAHIPTAEQPAVVVIIDEGQDSLPRTDTTTTFDGLRMTASELLHACTRAAASAAVVFIEAGQDGLVAAQGKSGPSIERNQTVRLCGKTMTHSDGQRTLPALRNVDTTKLTGHLWLYQGSTDDPAVMVEEAKVEFIAQEDIPAVAETYTAWRPASVDTRHEPRMGPAWHGRWQPARLPEVAATAHAEGWTWPDTTTDAGPAGGADGGADSGAEDLTGAPFAHYADRDVDQDDRPDLDQLPPEVAARVREIEREDPDYARRVDEALANRDANRDADRSADRNGRPLSADERAAFDAIASHVDDHQDDEQSGQDAGQGDDDRQGDEAPRGGAFDPTAALDAIRRATASFRRPGGAQATGSAAGAGRSTQAWERVPEPLRSVAQMLQSPDAPRDWVSTLALARQLGRVDDSANEIELQKAVGKLGKELWDSARVKSGRAPRDGKSQLRGYEVSKLLEAAGQFMDSNPDSNPGAGPSTGRD